MHPLVLFTRNLSRCTVIQSVTMHGHTILKFIHYNLWHKNNTEHRIASLSFEKRFNKRNDLSGPWRLCPNIDLWNSVTLRGSQALVVSRTLQGRDRSRSSAGIHYAAALDRCCITRATSFQITWQSVNLHCSFLYRTR